MFCLSELEKNVIHLSRYNFILGLDSEFALFETVLVTLYDAFPELRSKKVGRGLGKMM